MKNEEDLIANLKCYYDQSLMVLKDFGGPSVYFHTQAVKEHKVNFLSDRHVEMIYATLSSWGMHRMGDPKYTKAKMVEFKDFKQSIIDCADDLERVRHFKMELCSKEEYEKLIDTLKTVYFTMKVSISDATVVAHSKTLAHIVPNLIPPIDRQYTIRFFTQDHRAFFTESGKYKLINLPKGIEEQFTAFKYYSCKMKALLDHCDRQLFKLDCDTFNTSYPKVIDNLIMAYVKSVPKPKNETKFL